MHAIDLELAARHSARSLCVAAHVRCPPDLKPPTGGATPRCSLCIVLTGLDGVVRSRRSVPHRPRGSDEHVGSHGHGIVQVEMQLERKLVTNRHPVASDRWYGGSGSRDVERPPEERCQVRALAGGGGGADVVDAVHAGAAAALSRLSATARWPRWDSRES